MNVGDIVKFTNLDGEEVVGIVYENGNKTFSNFRVQTIGNKIKKYRTLEEGQLTPATAEELSQYVQGSFTKLIADWGPESVIAKETEESGGELPPQLTEPPIDPLEGLSAPDFPGLN